MRRVAAGIVMLLLGYTPVYAEATEYQIKAAMLANFALFVDWPPAAFSTAESPFVACVLGEDPFGPWLKHELGERVGSRRVEIRHLEKAEDAPECHLVFICRSEQPRLKQMLTSLSKTGVLIVGESSDVTDFCRNGGMIGFVMEGRKVRFKLNANAVAKAGLKIDSKLKRVSGSTECGEGR
ncbi:MAG: hypothetical protein A2075_15455 [Geobacteraceae bacterium GWC2_58_44]|nr:MAG: hypothetical protein A2075_15455 [Geobacteraceae bacterium GWC2_58_44]HBG07351.1 DUF4154 domain-containing protein [Geobacter sp.]